MQTVGCLLIVTAGQKKWAHVVLVVWGKLNAQSVWTFFILEQVKFRKKRKKRM